MKSILVLVRTEEAKAERRRLGDRGGIAFRKSKVLQPRPDGCSNTLTGVIKDNLLFEVYEATDFCR